jgi:hypothetical protein
MDYISPPHSPKKLRRTINKSSSAEWEPNGKINGMAENAIKILVSKAQTMMIYTSLMWPEAKDEALWPMAISHAAYLYNHTLNEVTGIAPIEIFLQTTNEGQALRKAHPWGCPADVLDPRLTLAGAKIPKWQPRSRRGQYIGVSPVHAENISLIRNLSTGYIPPNIILSLMIGLKLSLQPKNCHSLIGMICVLCRSLRQYLTKGKTRNLWLRNE